MSTPDLPALRIARVTDPLGAGAAVGDLWRYQSQALGGQWITPANPGGVGTATAVAGAATLNTQSGTVTSEALIAATAYTLTLTNNKILATSIVLVNLTNSAGLAVALLTKVVGSGVTLGTVVISMSFASLTGTVVVDFVVMN
jgi:hypothetical protein